MERSTNERGRRARVALAAVAAAGAVSGLAACGSSSTTTAVTTLPAAGGRGAGGSSAAEPRRGSGPVDVLYAGSLVNLMEKQVGPAFDAATGYTFTGFSGGSAALATQIKGRLRQGDVFISASRSVNASLEGTANGNWVSWYASFASSPLVLGYNPASRFTNDIRTKPWYQVVTEPGILVGRTDPSTDPKGKLTTTALEAAARQYGSAGLARMAQTTSDVYPEESLVGRRQAGQLDAGFFYSSEATAASIPSVAVTVPGQDLKATYTVTILEGAPDERGAEAFVAFLLGPEGRAFLGRDGFELTRPAAVSGTGVPPAVERAIGGP
jgi:molybdate/tungstate transport system substrate-binding protein